jgi:hypothetical protein
MLGAGMGVVVVGVMVAAVGVGAVDSRAFKFKQFKTLELLFLGQLRAMCPWVQHLKHLPSVQYLVHSSSVNFWKGTDIFVESMSMGTCWLLDEEWDVCWFVWYACWSHGWFQHGPMSPALWSSLTLPTSFLAASFHCVILVGKFLRFTTCWCMFSCSPAL